LEQFAYEIDEGKAGSCDATIMSFATALLQLCYSFATALLQLCYSFAIFRSPSPGPLNSSSGSFQPSRRYAADSRRCLRPYVSSSNHRADNVLRFDRLPRGG